MIPFDKPRYVRYLVGVLLAMALIFIVSVAGFEYEMTTADIFCSPIACVLTAYFLHLMFWQETE